MESLPTEILFNIVERLDNQETKQFSCVSKRMREVCLPFIFRKVGIEFSNKGFDLLETILESKLHQHIISFQYIVPNLLKPEIQNYEFFKTNILTPEDYVEMCEQYEITGILEDWQDVDGPKDLDDLLYLSDGHPSYTHVYKTLRMKYFEQQQIINDKRDSRSLKLAFQQFFNLRELSLVFSQAQGNEHWERDYQDMFDVADLKSYQHHIQLVLAGLVTKQNAPLREIELHSLKLPIGAFTFPEDPPPDYLHWNSLTTVLTELVKHTPRLRLVESGLALALLSRESLNIKELDLRSIDTGMVFVESFLQYNAKSLRSLVAHMIYVTGRDQGNSSYLTPTHISEIKGLRIEGQKRPYIDWAEKGWKLVFSHS